jgi:hypothetical protein
MSSEILKTTDETIIAPDNAGIEEEKTPEIVNEAAKTSALDDEINKRIKRKSS